MERPTIADVALRAGVARSTVSRALSRPERVNHHTRELIESVARELGYLTPRQAKKQLAKRVPQHIAVLLSDVTNPFYFDVIRGIQAQAQAAGLLPLLIDTEESGERERSVLTSLRETAQGAVVAASRLPDDVLTGLSAQQRIVVINRRPHEVSNVIINTQIGIREAVDHLASLGHRSVLYVGGPEFSWSNELRWKACKEAAEALGLGADCIGPFEPRLGGGAVAADIVLSRDATAVIAFNDLLAIGMLERLRERGASVPNDVSLIGCDDIFGTTFSSPPLTTIAAPIVEVGRAAVSLLLRDVDAGEEPRSAVLAAHLTIRSSTGPVKPRAGRA